MQQNEALLGTSGADGHGNDVVFDSGRNTGAVRKASRQHAAVLAAFVEVHIDNLEGHVLRAGIAHHCRGLQVSQADL